MNIIRAGQPQKDQRPFWIRGLSCLVLLGMLVLCFVVAGSYMVQGVDEWKLEKQTTLVTLETVKGGVIQDARVSEDLENITLLVQTTNGDTQEVTFSNTFPLYATMADPEAPTWD